MRGKLSIFGGSKDSGMTETEGLACFEHHEADLRPDLFNARSCNLEQGTSKRLRDEALYFACRFNQMARHEMQACVWILMNGKKMVVASLADWGPHESTGRTFDVSPRVAELLGVQTDDEIDGFPIA